MPARKQLTIRCYPEGGTEAVDDRSLTMPQHPHEVDWAEHPAQLSGV